MASELQMLAYLQQNSTRKSATRPQP